MDGRDGLWMGEMGREEVGGGHGEGVEAWRARGMGHGEGGG